MEGGCRGGRREAGTWRGRDEARRGEEESNDRGAPRPNVDESRPGLVLPILSVPSILPTVHSVFVVRSGFLVFGLLFVGYSWSLARSFVRAIPSPLDFSSTYLHRFIFFFLSFSFGRSIVRCVRSERAVGGRALIRTGV